MTDGDKQVCPLVEYDRVEGERPTGKSRTNGVVSVVESLTMVEQTHASERRAEEGEGPFNFHLQAEKDFIEGVFGKCFTLFSKFMDLKLKLSKHGLAENGCPKLLKQMI